MGSVRKAVNSHHEINSHCLKVESLGLETFPWYRVCIWSCAFGLCIFVFQRNGSFLSVVVSSVNTLPFVFVLDEAQNAQQLHERIQSSSMDAKLEALKDLASLSRDVTFAQEFINLDGISLLTQMVESGTE